MPARGLPGVKVRMNLQTGAGKGEAVCTFFTNTAATYGVRFDTSFLIILVLTIIQATNAISFIHSSLVNP